MLQVKSVQVRRGGAPVVEIGPVSSEAAGPLQFDFGTALELMRDGKKVSRVNFGREGLQYFRLCAEKGVLISVGGVEKLAGSMLQCNLLAADWVLVDDEPKGFNFNDAVSMAVEGKLVRRLSWAGDQRLNHMGIKAGNCLELYRPNVSPIGYVPWTGDIAAADWVEFTRP